MNQLIKRTVLSLALFGVFGAANATVLVNNVPTANVDVVGSFFGGTLLDSAITNVTSVSYTGTARTAVYDTGSGLDFYYQFSNDASSQTGIERLSAYDFKPVNGKAVSVYQTTAAFGIFMAGTENSEYADRAIGGVIGFNFVPNGATKIFPGSTSMTQIIRTDAREYMAGNMGILNGHASNAAAFAPTMALAVPEPESFAMLLAGLGLMGTIARRRMRNGS